MSDEDIEPSRAEINAAVDYVCDYFELNGIDVEKLDSKAINCCMSLWLETRRSNNKVDSLLVELKEKMLLLRA